MHKKFFLLLIFLVPLWAKPVDDLLDIMVEKNMTQMQTQMIEIIAGQNEAFKPYKNVVAKWVTTYLTWENMKNDMVKIYEKHYTDAEINDLLKFYETPTGKKTIKLTPIIFGEGAMIGTNLATKYAPELEKMLQKEIR